MREHDGKRRLVHLIYQNAKYAIDQHIGEQFAEMFPCLIRLDLSMCQISDEMVRIILAAFSDKDPEYRPTIEKLDLSGCSFTESAVQIFDEINRRRASDLIVFKLQDVVDIDKENAAACMGCCC